MTAPPGSGRLLLAGRAAQVLDRLVTILIKEVSNWSHFRASSALSRDSVCGRHLWRVSSLRSSRTDRSTERDAIFPYRQVQALRLRDALAGALVAQQPGHDRLSC
jgi:hypothetical protein